MRPERSSTHDPPDAFVVGDWFAVIERGRRSGGTGEDLSRIRARPSWRISLA
jgi:hypothetical protein